MSLRALEVCSGLYFLLMKGRILVHLSKNDVMVSDANNSRKKRIDRSSQYLAKSAIFILVSALTRTLSLSFFNTFSYAAVCFWAISRICAAIIGICQLLSFAEGEKLTKHARITILKRKAKEIHAEN